jgi:hypothetical protein
MCPVQWGWAVIVGSAAGTGLALGVLTCAKMTVEVDATEVRARGAMETTA